MDNNLEDSKFHLQLAIAELLERYQLLEKDVNQLLEKNRILEISLKENERNLRNTEDTLRNTEDKLRNTEDKLRNTEDKLDNCYLLVKISRRMLKYYKELSCNNVLCLNFLNLLKKIATIYHYEGIIQLVKKTQSVIIKRILFKN